MNLIDKIYYGITVHSFGSGGGGGGGAGVVDFPVYMKDFHGEILNNTGGDHMTSSLVDAMNAAIGNSPYLGVNAYAPDADIADYMAEVDKFVALVDLLSAGTPLDTLVSDVLDHTRIDDSVTEFSLDLDDRLTAEVLPRFEGGMRDINAVVSSAFAIGRGIIEAAQTRQVAKYSADLHMKALMDDAIKLIGLKLEYAKNAAHYLVEANRIKVVMKKEQTETDAEFDEADAAWDLGVFQHGANVLAGIQGGVLPSDKKKTNKMASALGGAMTGAAAGAIVGAEYGGTGGGPYGAVIGAVLGAAIGLMSS